MPNYTCKHSPLFYNFSKMFQPQYLIFDQHNIPLDIYLFSLIYCHFYSLTLVDNRLRLQINNRQIIEVIYQSYSKWSIFIFGMYTLKQICVRPVFRPCLLYNNPYSGLFYKLGYYLIEFNLTDECDHVKSKFFIIQQLNNLQLI